MKNLIILLFSLFISCKHKDINKTETKISIEKKTNITYNFHIINFKKMDFYKIPLGINEIKKSNLFPKYWISEPFEVQKDGKTFVAKNKNDQKLFTIENFYSGFYKNFQNNYNDNQINTSLTFKDIIKKTKGIYNYSESNGLGTYQDLLKAVNFEDKLKICAYSIIENDTLVYLTADKIYNYVDNPVGEGLPRYVNFILISNVKNKELNQFLLLGYEFIQGFQAPVRFFYIEKNEIYLLDLDLGEENRFLNQEKWVFENTNFIKKKI